MSNNKISVIFTEPYITFSFFITLKSILFQSHKNLEIIILTTDIITVNTFLSNHSFNNLKIKVISLKSIITITDLIKTITGDYILFNDYRSVNTINRLKKQLSFINSSNTKIVSCQSFPNIHNFNSYTTETSIDNAIDGGFLPIDISSLLISIELLKTAFYKSSILIKDNDNIILQLLKYSPITKLNKCLYFPLYKYNYTSTLNVYTFNKIEPLKYRAYFSEASKLLSYSKPLTSSYNNNNILMLTDSLDIGGTESYILSLTKGIKKLGFNVIIATCGGIGIDIFKFNNIEVFQISKDKNIALKELNKIIVNSNINLLHCHLPYSIELCRDIQDFINIPYIVTLHGMFYSPDLLNSICYSANKIISVSIPILNFLNSNVKFKNINSELIYNGINIDNSNEAQINSSSQKIITYCSRLDYSKGVLAENFLKDIFPLLKDNSNISCFILGDGTRKIVLESLVNDLNKSLKRHAITLYGAVYNVKEFFLNSHLIVGTGRVLLEGMSLKKPVIALGLKGLLGIVDNKNYIDMIFNYFGDHSYKDLSNGLSLNEMISSILNNPDYAKSLGDFNKELCELFFDENIINNKIADIYKETKAACRTVLPSGEIKM